MGRDATPSVQQELITLIKNQEIVAAAVLSLTSCKLRTMESARAKLQANNSPRSSPDEQGWFVMLHKILQPKLNQHVTPFPSLVTGASVLVVHSEELVLTFNVKSFDAYNVIRSS
ncbi:hypothetical protein ACOSQ2_011613 [Xanthoceras sorbifolium]